MSSAHMCHDQVRETTARLVGEPGSAEEFVEHCAFAAAVEKDRPAMDREYEEVSSSQCKVNSWRMLVS